MIKRYLAGAAVLLAAVASVWSGSRLCADVMLVESTTPLGCWGDECRKRDSCCISPDSAHLAYIAARDGKEYVVLDGVAQGEYDMIVGGRAGNLLFSPDGRHLVYTAMRGDAQFLVVDGVEGKEHVVVSSVVYSPDSKRMAYVTSRDGKVCVVVEGVPGTSYAEYVSAITDLAFSPDGRHVAYDVRLTRNNKRVTVVVVDGVESREYDSAGAVVFSPNGKRTAYAVQVCGKEYVVIDGVESAHYTHVESGPLFSLDSKHVAYVARYDGSWTVVRDGVESKSYDCINCYRLTFSPDGKHLAYVVVEGSKMFVAVDGVEKTKYDHVSQPLWSPAGDCVAYVAWRGLERFVVTGDVEGKKYDYINHLGFSPCGKHLSFVGCRSDWGGIVLDGVETTHNAGGFENPVVFSPDGKRSAITVSHKSDKNAIVVDGVEVPGYYSIRTPVFSPDSKHLVYWAWGGRKQFVVVDGVESREYAPVDGSSFVFDRPDRFHFIAIRGPQDAREIVRVDVRICQ